MLAFTAIQKIAELRRELKMRKRVYGHGRGWDAMTPTEQQQMLILEAIIADYEEEAGKERLL